jgi:hypothetical protein
MFLSKNTWQCFNGLIQMDKENIFIRSINNIVNSYKKRFKMKDTNTKIIFLSMVMIYDKYINGQSIDETLEKLNTNNKRLQIAISKKLKLIEEKLIKFNLYLRKYECPMSKLESLINAINNADLLKQMLEASNLLLGDNNYEEITGVNEKEKRKKRIELCDSKYDYALTINPDSTMIDFNFDKTAETCGTCSENKWAEIIVRYGCFFSKSLTGSKNNMTYILINIVQDVATLNNVDDPIITNIKHILKNIECRSNLRKVIEKRISIINTVSNGLNVINEGNENDENDPDVNNR